MDQKKIIIHFVPGSYGHFLKGLLCKSLKMPNNNISDFHWISNTDIIDTSHDLEKESKNFIIKITYRENDVDLINRNKWKKWPHNFEQSKQEAFLSSNDIDESTKEIITKSYFRSYLLKDMINWNNKVNGQTVEIPFNFFLLKKEEWITYASKIFEQCQIDYDVDYIQTAYSIFQSTQNSIINDHYENKLKEWKDKDIIEKSNLVSNFYFYKFFKDDNPVPPSKKYSNTSEMLASWVKLLDENNGVLNND